MNPPAGRTVSGRLIRYGAAFGGLLLSVTLGLTALAAVERDSRFCIACHLHEEKYDRFTGAPPADLVALHRAKKQEFQCIDCHGGADPFMRGRVWAVAAWDTARFLVGRYEEPTRMRLPLRDAECRQCHNPIIPEARSMAPTTAPSSPASAPPSGADEAATASYMADPYAERPAATAYHAVREHNTVKVACVRCHTSHTVDGGAASRFISKDIVQPICRECHKNL